VPPGSAHDRDIARLALPALGALAAEPLYVLVDTAIVGHLGTAQLAGLALAGTLLASAFWLFNFLAYGTTAQVSRLLGAGDGVGAARLAAQALWLAVGVGAGLCALFLALAVPAVSLMGGDGAAAESAVTYLRISALGAPFVMITLAGQGYLRGRQDMITPLKILLVANAANVGLELALVYGLDFGIAGSAWATVIAQAGAAACFLPRLLRAPERPRLARMRPLTRIGGDLFARTAALLVAFTAATAILARVDENAVSAHQVVFGVFVLLALVLDALAIAAQPLIGSALGAGEGRLARDVARRLVLWGLAAGLALSAILAALAGPLPRAFTSDPAVLDQVRQVWWLFVALQPANALVFVLDGVLIGAGDTRYLSAGMIAAVGLAFAPIAVATLPAGWGIMGVWAAIAALIGARLVVNLARFAGGRWAVLGVPREAGPA
jgi:MATE family, multidrug efflux pump